jgi:hypothetical protein
MGGTGAEPSLGCPSDSKLPPDEVLFVCSPPLTVEPTAAQPLRSGAGWVIGVTPDELVAVWTSPEVPSIRHLIAERGTVAYEFGEQNELSLTDVPIALSPDGLRLTLVSSDGMTLKEMGRSTRGELFGTPSEGPYANLNDKLAADNDTLWSLALGQDDLNLAYVTYDTLSGRSSLWVGGRDTLTDPFEVGEKLPSCETEGTAEAMRGPTSFSSDGLTLFFYDQVRGISRAAYRTSLSEPFEYFVDIPSGGELFVNEDCSRAFSGNPSGAGALVQVEFGD